MIFGHVRVHHLQNIELIWDLRLLDSAMMKTFMDTVDGSESCTPVEVGSLSHHLHGLKKIPGG